MVWADAGCACADTAIGCLPLVERPSIFHGPPTIIVGRKLAQAESAGSEMLRVSRHAPFGIPNDIQARTTSVAAVACRNLDFTAGGSLMSRAYNVIDAD